MLKKLKIPYNCIFICNYNVMKLSIPRKIADQNTKRNN